MTKRLYYEDAYIREFDARVLRCSEGEKGFEVVLDKSAFFPEGGGQPGDGGRLNHAEVVDVVEKDNEIIHICKSPLQAGSEVHGVLNWERRFLHMQQHSGEHIFSGIVHRLHGYDNIGFHMGKDCVTVDFNGLLTQEQIEEAQRQANDVVFSDERIAVVFPEREELESLDYRSKKQLDGDIRIVTVPGADICACCGTHVKRTGEIGLIKVTGSEHYKSGIRLTLAIGWKAYDDYNSKHRSVKAISGILSAKPEEIAEAVERQQEAYLELKNQMIALKQQILEYKVDQIPEGQPLALLFEPELNAVEIRKLSDRIMKKAGLVAVFSGSDEAGYKYVICSEKQDAVSVAKAFNEAVNGKGGGRNPMVQGTAHAGEEAIRNFFNRL